MSPPQRNDGNSELREQQRRARVQEWETALHVFRSFQTVAAPQRLHHLGLLFEHLAPWIERGIRNVSLRYFLLLPTELALARLFSQAARKEELPRSYEAFLLWVEASVLHDITDPSDALGATNGAVGEPSALLQQRFNQLPFPERALLYLFMVEKNSLTAVAERAGMSPREAAGALNRVWRKLAGGDPAVQLPLGWQAPEKLLGE